MDPTLSLSYYVATEQFNGRTCMLSSVAQRGGEKPGKGGDGREIWALARALPLDTKGFAFY